MAKTNSAAPVRVIEETPAYWRVVFDYPPFNILDATIFDRPPGSACSDGRQSEPARRRVRERDSRLLSRPL